MPFRETFSFFLFLWAAWQSAVQGSLRIRSPVHCYPWSVCLAGRLPSPFTVSQADTEHLQRSPWVRGFLGTNWGHGLQKPSASHSFCHCSSGQLKTKLSQGWAHSEIPPGCEDAAWVLKPDGGSYTRVGQRCPPRAWPRLQELFCRYWGRLWLRAGLLGSFCMQQACWANLITEQKSNLMPGCGLCSEDFKCQEDTRKEPGEADV